MSIPLLPSNILSEIFTQLLQEDIKFSNPGDNQNFQRFKRYLSKQWCRGIDAEILSVYSLENATNNGAESFHSMLKNVLSYSITFSASIFIGYSTVDQLAILKLYERFHIGDWNRKHKKSKTIS